MSMFLKMGSNPGRGTCLDLCAARISVVSREEVCWFGLIKKIAEIVKWENM